MEATANTTAHTGGEGYFDCDGCHGCMTLAIGVNDISALDAMYEDATLTVEAKRELRTLINRLHKNALSNEGTDDFI